MIHFVEGVQDNFNLEEPENKTLLEEFIASFDWQNILNQVLMVSLRILFAILIFYIFRKLVVVGIELAFDRYFKSQKKTTNRDRTVYKVTKNILNSIFYFFLIYTILEILNFPVGTLLASAGIVGLAVSLGAQGFVSDLVNGVTILMEGQLDIGDEVTLKEITGTVLNVNLRSTQVKDFDGTIHFIPNREISVISNRSKSDMRVKIDILLDPETDIHQAREIIEQVNAQHIPKHSEITVPPGEILFVANEENKLIARVIMYTKAGSQYSISNRFYEHYIEALLKAKILPL